MMKSHVPVLLKEIIDGLAIHEGNRYIDATIGLGGHAKEIENHGGIVLGIDQDTDALHEAVERVNATLVHGNFRDIQTIAHDHGFTNIDGVVMDLGVSSLQLDSPERGFSYRYKEAPLDLRMNQQVGIPASQIINTSDEQTLYDILSTFGEEQRSRSISAALIRARPIRTVGDVVSVIGNEYDVLSRVFQALRIAVNDELASLKKGLEGSETILKPGGKLVVISFHSLEDRIVKLFMKRPLWKLETKHPIVPSEQEIMGNRRARSAKLRIATKNIL